jgi:hypothetical protein
VLPTLVKIFRPVRKCNSAAENLRWPILVILKGSWSTRRNYSTGVHRVP